MKKLLILFSLVIVATGVILTTYNLKAQEVSENADTVVVEDTVSNNEVLQETIESEDETGKLEKERADFMKETETLRNDMYQKRLELSSEFAKETPDIGTARKLQKEISDLRSQLDQKRMDHIVNLKKVNPNIGRGFMSRGPRGLHRGPHRW